MKYCRKFLMSVFILSLLLITCLSPLAANKKNSTGKTARILFTSDLHSNILPYTTFSNREKIIEAGGFSRLATLIKDNTTDTTFLVDGGDFSMGSLFNALFKTDAPELNLMSKLGYDAITLGNHDFDYGLKGLSDDLNAVPKNQAHPVIVASNLVYGDDEASKTLKTAMENFGALETMIIAKGDVKIGLFGLLSKNAQDFTNNESLTFEDTVKTAKACVAKLKEQKADVIVCLSHGGTDEDASKSEDQILAKKVDGIDVIISGHMHSTLKKPIIENNTIIVSCGWRGENLGVLDLTIDEKGEVSLGNYELKANNRTVKRDKDMSEAIQGYVDILQEKYLNNLGKKVDDIALFADYSMEKANKMNTFGNHSLMDLIADAYMYTAKQNKIDADVSLITAGLIRDTVYEGSLSESDIFNILSLGESSDGSLGYALTDAYLTGEDLTTLCQLDTIADFIMPEAHMGFSGLRYTYNNTRLPMNRVTGVDIQQPDGTWQPIVPDAKYHIITSQYNMDMIGTIADLSKGLIQFSVYDANGKLITDTDQAVSKSPDGKILKEWVALSDYCHSFDTNEDGIPVLSDDYKDARATKTVDNQTGFFDKTSKYTWIVYGIILGILVLIILIIILVVRIIRRKRKNKNQRKIKYKFGTKL